jgi:hypothetical protein
MSSVPEIGIRLDTEGNHTSPHGRAHLGCAALRAASALHPDSGAWAFFMREIVRLPREMTPAVSQVVRLGWWKLAEDPIAEVRLDAIEVHRRAWPNSVLV